MIKGQILSIIDTSQRSLFMTLSKVFRHKISQK